MYRMRSAVAVALVMGVLLATPTEAQTGATLRVARHTVVMENPRGDSFPVGSVDSGEVLEVRGRQGNWYLVIAPAGRPWVRGWVSATSVVLLSPLPTAAKPAPGRLMIRGFGQAGGTLFSAKDSFETILGTAAGSMFGGGGQVVFPNGAFVQGSVERFTKTGSRVLVSGTQVFTLQIPDVVTVTPIQLTLGYRDHSYRAASPYLGIGLGWQAFREESPSLADAQRVSSGHIGYHILGGAERSISSWLSVAGEIQWTSVPKALGDTGVSAVFKEDDLGGVSFRFKLILGY
jgi:hypothetical protein